jgi:hypothetical protein
VQGEEEIGLEVNQHGLCDGDSIPCGASCQKSPLTQENYASDFDHIDDLEQQETIINKRLQKVNRKMHEFDEKDKNHGGNGNNTCNNGKSGNKTGNSKDDAIAID